MKIDAYENDADMSLKSAAPGRQHAAFTDTPAQRALADSQAGLDSRQLRQILREELREISRSDKSQAPATTQAPGAPVYDSTEMQYQRELVLEEMDLLRQRESVSSGELDKLLGDIARLEPEARTDMLRELTQAMNRGEINGHL